MLYHIKFRFHNSHLPELPLVWPESDDEETQEGTAQGQGNSMRAYTWWFSARVLGNLVDSSPISIFKALLDGRKERQKECLVVADTITFACSDLSLTEPRTISVEGFVHGSDKIGECSLNQWLPLNHELRAIEFEAVHPGRGQLDRRYRKHTTIQKFLDETSLEPSAAADGKRVRFDFHGSSAEPERPHL